ncbi:hypothetical protein [Rubellicoccus peritrichatus]|uniref:Uncharacterized protein n=1 Tax=Rubellicoccus peritrichatus TaxID=3080537 RepID=A0AAQ3LBW2_9BACT|nr:hypothetical protein [Puniceicoccus sp. CR14]WOO41542.1 hypothetical protein RZN69_00475 [Puniceicoccus sp. CR14]
MLKSINAEKDSESSIDQQKVLELYQASAVKAGDWMVNNQVRKPFDANYGRLLYARLVKGGWDAYSTNWTTGFGAIALLSLYDLTKDEKYLESAEYAIRYIKSLQCLDSRKPCSFGAIVEETPQSEWIHPRDGLSAAWALLCYGRYMSDAQCIERAVLYADWILKNAYRRNWILATVALGPSGRDTDITQASCQGGAILFFLDLYRETQNFHYLDAAHSMSDYYVEKFISPDGEITILYDDLTGRRYEDEASLKKFSYDWREMHKINDDFSGISLIESFQQFGVSTYRDRLKAYAKWIFKKQNADGGFMKPELEVGSATAVIFLTKYLEIAEPEEVAQIEDTIARSLHHLMSLQQVSDDKGVNGAFLGMNSACTYGNGEWINLRVSAYGVFALLMQSGHSLFPLRKPSLE